MTKINLAILLLISTFIGSIAMASPKPKVKDKVRDLFVPVSYETQKASFDGYIGERMKINIEKRLLSLNTQAILDPYINRPGKQTWIGEHVGKFLHASAYAYEYTHDERIKTKMDSVAKALIATQLTDGYLGTYVDSARWTDWDVWSHKYNLIGLLKYYETTGYEPALNSGKKIGDLLYKVFVEKKKDIIKASWHVGMAATSVLEPMVMLYRYTGEKKYLDFCNHILTSWEQENGPKILTSLLQSGNVFETANGKAYEMLSNIVGLADLYRSTGDQRYFTAVKNAWADVRKNRHYIIGTTSWGEHFKDNFLLQPDGQIDGGSKFNGPGEGCVTVTWLQLNWQLLKLTGELQYGEELERIMFNSLPGAQSPQNGSVCYFVPLEGRKRFGEVSHGIEPDVSCCSSSIPRGMSLIPWFTAGLLSDKPALIQYVPGTYSFNVKSKNVSNPVDIIIQTKYPKNGEINLTVNPAQNSSFPLLLRVPAWCSSFKVSIGSEKFSGEKGAFLTIERAWKKGDQVKIEMSVDLQVIADPNRGSDKVIIQRGPQILATDDMIDTLEELPKEWIGNQFYVITGSENGNEKKLRMVPFAEAGQTKGHYQVLQKNTSNVQYVK